MPDLSRIQLNTPNPLFDQLAEDLQRLRDLEGAARLALATPVEWAPVVRRPAPWARELSELAADLAEFLGRQWEQVMVFAFLTASYLAFCVAVVYGSR